MNFKQLNGKSIREAFQEFDRQNSTIYGAFEKQAIRAITQGAKKISSKAIVNWLRWEWFVKTSDGSFKINDAFTPHYARKFIRLHPQWAGIFELRKLRSEEVGPYMTVGEDGQLSFF